MPGAGGLAPETAMKNDRSSNRSNRLWLLALVLLIGLLIGAALPWEVDQLLAFGRDLAGKPWFMLAVVAGMALLFTFGLPGSVGLWLIAPFQTPALATVLLVGGSVGGALGAYRFSAHLRGDWEPQGFSRRIVDLLAHQNGVWTQMALRVLPGFPHSVLNFAGGVLGLGLRGFVGAAIVGLSIKWAVYASAVHGLVEAVEVGAASGMHTLLPLSLLSGLLLAGVLVRRRIGKRAG